MYPKSIFEPEIDEFLKLKSKSTQTVYKASFNEFLSYYRQKHGKGTNFGHFLDNVTVTNMTVFKQHPTKKQREEGKPADKLFRDVPILKEEPLAPYMLTWVERVQKLKPRIGTDKLFTYKYDWLYRKVTSLDKEWFPHRFRIERATQLAKRYHFNTNELMEYFGWKIEKMANHYASLDKEALFNRMRARR